MDSPKDTLAELLKLRRAGKLNAGDGGKLLDEEQARRDEAGEAGEGRGDGQGVAADLGSAASEIWGADR